MRISRKQANQIAALINTCTVWGMMVRDEVAGDNDWRKVDHFMDRHDEAGKELNELLGVEAVVLYNRALV